MLKFIPIHQGALERSSTLKEWLTSYLCSDMVFLETSDWFHRAHGEAPLFVWSPAPPVADACLSQLCEARHTRPYIGHVVVIPNVMTGRWRKNLRKVADVVIKIPIGVGIWPETMHESLTLAILCPLLNRSPWRVRPTTLARDFETEMSGMWNQDCRRQGNCLRKFWLQSTALDSMSGGLARKLLQAAPRRHLPGTRFGGR